MQHAGAENREERLVVLRAPERFVGDDEAVVRGPDGRREATFLSSARDEVSIEDLEAQAEASLELFAPLQRDGCRADDQNTIDPLAEHELLHHQPGLDGLSEADVVRDEQVDPRELEGLLERNELVIEQVNACTERSLEKTGIGRGDRAPLERVQIRREASRLIELRGSSEPRSRWLDDPRAELSFPQD